MKNTNYVVNSTSPSLLQRYSARTAQPNQEQLLSSPLTQTYYVPSSPSPIPKIQSQKISPIQLVKRVDNVQLIQNSPQTITLLQPVQVLMQPQQEYQILSSAPPTPPPLPPTTIYNSTQTTIRDDSEIIRLRSDVMDYQNYLFEIARLLGVDGNNGSLVLFSVKRLIQQLNEQNLRNQEQESQIKSLQDYSKQYKLSMEDYKRKVIELENDLSGLREQLRVANLSLIEYQEKLSGYDSIIIQLKAEIQRLNDIIIQLNSQITHLENEIEYFEELKTRYAEMAKKQSDKTAILGVVALAFAEIDTLRERIEETENNTSTNQQNLISTLPQSQIINQLLGPQQSSLYQLSETQGSGNKFAQSQYQNNNNPYTVSSTNQIGNNSTFGSSFPSQSNNSRSSNQVVVSQDNLGNSNRQGVASLISQINARNGQYSQASNNTLDLQGLNKLGGQVNGSLQDQSLYRK